MNDQKALDNAKNKEQIKKEIEMFNKEFRPVKKETIAKSEETSKIVTNTENRERIEKNIEEFEELRNAQYFQISSETSEESEEVSVAEKFEPNSDDSKELICSEDARSHPVRDETKTTENSVTNGAALSDEDLLKCVENYNKLKI